MKVCLQIKMNHSCEENSESEDDWFNQDEEELLNKLSNKLQKKDESKVEYIKLPSNSVDTYLREHRLNAAAASNSSTGKSISIEELRKLSKATPLEVFLFAFTTPIDFFASQIFPNDSVERVQLYTRILAAICGMNLPGFHTELLMRFAENNELLEQLQFIATKFLTKHQVAESKEGRQMLFDMESLFLETFKENLLTVKCKIVINHVCRLIKNDEIWQKIKQHEGIMQETQFKEHEETSSKHKEQLYPSLEELLEPVRSLNTIPDAGNSIKSYLERQQQLLKYDFLTSLQNAVQTLRTHKELPPDWLVVESVRIKFNEQLEGVQRNERVMVDLMLDRSSVIPSSLTSKIKRLKVGTLLCFTTNRHFDNLIYATFNYTNEDLLNSGYLSIEILRQYNIGNICKQNLIMFEAPTFFEPYNHVYNCLTRFKLKSDLPFSQYLIKKQSNLKLENLKPPAYLREQEEFKTADLTNLNASQVRAYKSALKQEMCLIQGPPGTGKTHLSVKFVHSLMENTKNSPIVLITYTNDSLDKFLLSLAEHTTNFMRFGSRSREPKISALTAQEPSLAQLAALPKLKRLYFLTKEQLSQRTNELKNLQDLFDGSDEEYLQIVTVQQNVNFVEQKLNTLKIIFQYYSAREKQLIAMTTTFAAKTQLIFNLLQSKIVVFEEAAEILESHVIACLSAYTQHVIMVGDHLQLQPFTSNYALRRAYSLNVSLFERLIEEGLPYTQLTTQYRMRPEIAKLLTPLFYNELNNAECVEKYELVREMHANLYFCTHQQMELVSTDGGSYGNEYEARELVKLMEHLCLVGKYAAEDIAILTPYAMQVGIIRKYLTRSQIKEAGSRVFTVDSFQGLEANIVLLSLVRSNKKQSIGFLNDKHRICVALSRARLGLYIIGDLDLLTSNSENWQKIKLILENKSAIGNKFPYSNSGEN